VLKEEFLRPRKESLIDLGLNTDIPAYELEAVIAVGAQSCVLPIKKAAVFSGSQGLHIYLAH
jgi:hypothetical protein